MFPCLKKIHKIVPVLMVLTLLAPASFFVLSISAEEPQTCDIDRSAATGAVLFPTNNSKVSGAVQIIIKVTSCRCIGTTSLYVDGKFHDTGHGFQTEDGEQYFVHFWNTYLYDNGDHTVNVLGKHNGTVDTLTLSVENTGDQRDYPDTFIMYPFNNSIEEGSVTITTLIRTCNCTGRPNIYVDDTQKALMSSNDWVLAWGLNFEQFQYIIDTTDLTDGNHKIRVDDKHSGAGVEIYINVDNTDYQGDDDDDDDVVLDDDEPITEDPWSTCPPPDDDDDPDEKESVLDGPYRSVLLGIPALVLAAILIILAMINIKINKKKKEEDEDNNEQNTEDD